jgi:putative RNA 2'-phosphotransferase
MEKQLKHISKLLSLVLRHEPEHIGLTLNEQGWAQVPELIAKVKQTGLSLDFTTLQIIVDTNDKKRFAFNEDKTLIRANQGHSIEVDLQLTQQVPPPTLFHGTAEKNISLIKQRGLRKMNRHHVHLTASEETALKVGQRHGKPVILTIQALAMHEQQYIFYVSGNGVWLTDQVPVDFIAW